MTVLGRKEPQSDPLVDGLLLLPPVEVFQTKAHLLHFSHRIFTLFLLRQPLNTQKRRKMVLDKRCWKTGKHCCL